MAQPHVLVIDDDPAIRGLIKEILTSQGCYVHEVANGKEGLECLNRHSIDVVFVDLCLPDWHGNDVVRHVNWIRPGTASVIVTGHPTLESSIGALRLGVCDYVNKPFTRDQIIGALWRATRQLAPDDNTSPSPRSALGDHQAPIAAEMVSSSSSMREVISRARRMAESSVPVLILGEKGTGKSHLARFIHQHSGRANCIFKHILCNAVREERLERLLSEGFGDGRSFALDGEKCSLLEEARGGTVLFDEINELPVWAQAALVHLLEDDFGATTADVRVIASASRNVDTDVSGGGLHRELYFFLKAGSIWIPPLRQRREDIRPLAEHLLAKCIRWRESRGDESIRFSDAAMEVLSNYHWPRNIRELANVIERAILVTETREISADTVTNLIGSDGGTADTADSVTVPLLGNLKDIERWVVRQVIQRHNGNKAAAARALGMHRRTIYRLLDESDRYGEHSPVIEIEGNRSSFGAESPALN